MKSVNQVAEMNAVAFEAFGDANVLKVSRRPKPVAKADEVLVRISHTSVNPVDWKIRLGFLQGMLPHVFPIIPGWDAAGTIEAVGDSVRGFKVGDRVAAYTRLPEVHSGTYAEYISLPANFLAPVANEISFEQAAGVPLVALTAMQALTDFTRVKAGDKVLVLNGAGGVGSFAIQFAKQLGAHVSTTTSSKNSEYVKSLGADKVIDYSNTNLSESAKMIAPSGFDFILDAVGGEALLESFGLVRKGGHIVSIVDVPNEAEANRLGIKASFHFVYPNGDQLKSIFDGIQHGKTKIPPYQVRPVTEAVEAHGASQDHHVRGKIVLKIQFKY